MFIRDLTPELQQVAIQQLREDFTTMPCYLQEIRDWLNNENHQNILRKDDQWIITFLRCCKYDIEKTKSKMKGYYSIRKTYSQYFLLRNPFRPEIQQILNLGLCVPILNNKSVIFVVRPTMCEPNTVSGIELTRIICMTLDLLMAENDNLIINGVTFVWDLCNSSLGHTTQYPFSTVRACFNIFFQGYPLRLRKIHILNPPFGFNAIFEILKLWTNQKAQKKIIIHNTKQKETIFKEIPREILPSNYGGTSKSLDEFSIEWKKEMEANRNFFDTG